MSAWPWHRTRFYLEWIEDMNESADRAEQERWMRELVPEGAGGVEVLAGIGATVREVR